MDALIGLRTVVHKVHSVLSMETSDGSCNAIESNVEVERSPDV